MDKKVIKNSYYKVSQIEPELLRKFMINEIGEKAKEKLYNYLKDLAECYPKFDEWFDKTVIPEMELKDGKREIIIVISELESSHRALLTGIAILKKTQYEKKICTFRIHEDYRNQGIGTELFEKCFEYLGTRKPIITISDKSRDMFEKHIIKYGFEKKQELKDYYKQGTIECVYNGFLEE